MDIGLRESRRPLLSPLDLDRERRGDLDLEGLLVLLADLDLLLAGDLEYLLGGGDLEDLLAGDREDLLGGGDLESLLAGDREDLLGGGDLESLLTGDLDALLAGDLVALLAGGVRVLDLEPMLASKSYLDLYYL